ncbi:MAG: hypothetical protein COX81_03275 [Candidatus Magasanikbacteria bacterium CG_4_10_14_0_2_um_filter_37_12]|uniref:GGDEF domain-containing protein n=1 Tax=Candidatus Magasanikbacteria bacterium CG_4_10_14_0_2_um_filter_37_12 TaxID=1974637 RepID=A0A2M7V7A3_9BACT|nr:MAG: hypothetical protein COX81_03275 [Candidatus Magasanikbacteria bacterium CG_4_10_14_0_2_um_filter_37_12]
MTEPILGASPTAETTHDDGPDDVVLTDKQEKLLNNMFSGDDAIVVTAMTEEMYTRYNMNPDRTDQNKMEHIKRIVQQQYRRTYHAGPPTKQIGYEEKARRKKEFLRFLRSIEFSTADIYRLEIQADYDELTGALRPAAFGLRYERALQNMPEGHKGALMFIDLDNFKIVNDTHGHNAGNVVLKALVEKINESIRGTDALCRFGGDEFMILLSEIKESTDKMTEKHFTAKENMRRTIERIFQNIAELCLIEDVSEVGKYKVVSTNDSEVDEKDILYRFSMSVGACELQLQEGEKPTLDVIQSRADQGAYTTKSEGKNGITFITGINEDSTLSGETEIYQDSKFQTLKKQETIKEKMTSLKELNPPERAEELVKIIEKALDASRAMTGDGKGEDFPACKNVKLNIKALAQSISECYY